MPTYQEKNGHTSSIMDYARFNYVAQPEDNVKICSQELVITINGLSNGVILILNDAKTEEEEKAVLNEHD